VGRVCPEGFETLSLCETQESGSPCRFADERRAPGLAHSPVPTAHRRQGNRPRAFAFARHA
jgi:hypothetical protein